MKRFTRPVTIGCLLLTTSLGLTGALSAQNPSVDTAFAAPVFTNQADPNGVLVLPDGRFYVFSGATIPFIGFDRLDDVARGNLLRFNADGSLDATFAFDAQLHAGSVTVAASSPGGKLVVGVFFGSNAGSKVYRLNADGSIDSTFNPGAGTSGLFRALAVQADGKVLIGGSASIAYNGTADTVFQRLNADGSVDTAFNVTLTDESTPQYVSDVGGLSTDGAILVQSDGKIIVSGTFNRVNGVTVPAVARLNSDGSVDTGFVPSGFSIRSSPTSSSARAIRTAALQSDGKIVLGGRFNATSSTQYQSMVRLNTNGSVDSTFNAPFGGLGSGFHLRLQADGKVLLNTTFGLFGRYNANGAADGTFTPPSFQKLISGMETDAVVSNFGYLPDGKIVAVGSFDLANTSPRSGFVRLNADGTLDASFNPGKLQYDSAPVHLAVRPDGTILASGTFDAANGQPRSGLALLGATGSLNATVLPAPFFSDAYDGPDFLLQPDGKIFLFGPTPQTDQSGASGFTYLRLNADLSVDPTLTANASVTAFTSAVYQPGNGYLVSAGRFDPIVYIASTNANGGNPSFFLKRLNLQGAPDSGFQPDVYTNTIFQGYGPGSGSATMVAVGNDTVLAVQPDGKILYKYFTLSSSYTLVRLNANGTLDTTFQSGQATPGVAPTSGYTSTYDLGAGSEQAQEIYASSDGISGLVVQGDGKLLLYGDLTAYNGQTAGGLLRLNADGTRDAGFGAGTGPGGVSGASITDLKVQPDGKLLLVGNFQTFSGVAAPGIVRLNADGSVDGGFQVSGLAYKQVDIGVSGLGGGLPRLTLEPDGSYLLTGNYVTASGQGPGSIIHLLVGNGVSPFFNGQVPLGNGVYYLQFPSGNPFGYYSYLADPHYIYHFDLGYEYVFDAADGHSGVYLYDFASNGFFYTSPGFPFPYLYDFTLNTVLYYYPDPSNPGHYNTDGYRFFYRFDNGQIIVK